MMFPSVHGVAGAERPKFIDVLTALSLTTNLKLCLDAGDSNSYTGGTKWLDLSASNANFFRGATINAETDDPTFEGDVGVGGEAEHFSFDGGDFFKFDSANQTWMQNLHKNNALFTVISFLNVPTLAAGWFGDNASTLGEVGMFLHISASDSKPRFIVSKLGGEAVLTIDADNAVEAGVWHMLGASVDEAAGSGGGFLYKDGAFDQVSSADTWDATYVSPSSSGSGRTLEIGALGNAAGVFASGSKMACLAAWEGQALTKVQLDSIFTRMRGRFGI